MLIARAPDIRSSEITPEAAYLDRRAFLVAAGIAGAGAAAALAARSLRRGPAGPGSAGIVAQSDGTIAAGDEELTSYEDVTTYNNFYEFGTGKSDPSRHAGQLKTRPWTVEVGGLVRRPGRWHLEDLVKPHKVVDRIYRLRCVEAWSMVIPWQGIPLRDILARFEPLPGARYVRFTTLHRPSEMPGQRRGVLDWPYVEALRLDEAQHPLTLMATGLYGRALPNPNGAPIRLVVPWKYGFKGIKSIVRIELTSTVPDTTWNRALPGEYGFYANVNPHVDHPRWTQSRERRIGEWRRRETLMFNGYGDQVASMYAGMDLRRFY